MGALDRVIQSLDLQQHEKPESDRDARLSSFGDELGRISKALAFVLEAMNSIVDRHELQISAMKGAAGAMSGAGDNVVQSAKEIVAARAEIRKTLLGIAEELQALPDKFPVPEKVQVPDHSKALNRLEAAISAVPGSIEIPRTDLSPVTDALTAVLMKLDEPMVIDDREPREWDFEVEYEDFSDRVKAVHAREVR